MIKSVSSAYWTMGNELNHMRERGAQKGHLGTLCWWCIAGDQPQGQITGETKGHLVWHRACSESDCQDAIQQNRRGPRGKDSMGPINPFVSGIWQYKKTECSIQKNSNLKILALGMDQFEFCRGCVLRLAWPLEGEEYLGRHWSSLLKWKPNLFALGVVHFGCVWFEEWREPSSSHSSLFYLVCGMAWVDLSPPHSPQANN